MRYLLTGAGGFWGRHVRHAIAARGGTCFSMGTGQTGGEGHFALSSVRDEDGIRRALEAARPGVILHLAGAAPPASPEVMEDVNARYALAITRAMRDAGFTGRLVAAGSAAEYGPVPAVRLPVREETTGRPVSPYGVTKLAQTGHVLAAGEAGADVTVFRAFNLLGPGMPGHLLLPSLVRRMTAAGGGEMAVANLDSTRDFMDVRDAARLLLAVAEAPGASGRIVNCCTQRETRVGTLAEMTATALSLDLHIVEDPDAAPDRNPRSVGSSEQLFSLVGPGSFRAIRESVSETIEHMMRA